VGLSQALGDMARLPQGQRAAARADEDGLGRQKELLELLEQTDQCRALAGFGAPFNCQWRMVFESA
jgi:hypothetical protein